MSKSLKVILISAGIIADILAMIASLLWLLSKPDWEPLIAVLVSISALIWLIAEKLKADDGQALVFQNNSGKGNNNQVTGNNNTVGNNYRNNIVSIEASEGGSVNNVMVHGVHLAYSSEKLPFNSLAQLKHDSGEKLKERIEDYAQVHALNLNTLCILAVPNTNASDTMGDVMHIVRQSGLFIAGSGKAHPMYEREELYNGLSLDNQVMNKGIKCICLIVGNLKT